MDQEAEKKLRQKSNRTRQKNQKGDSKVESNDSLEIPDREGRHQTSLASLWGSCESKMNNQSECVLTTILVTYYQAHLCRRGQHCHCAHLVMKIFGNVAQLLADLAGRHANICW